MAHPIWVAVTGDEMRAMDSSAVGNEADARLLIEAVKSKSAIQSALDSRLLVPSSERLTLIPHKEFCNDIPVIDISGLLDDGRRGETIAAVVNAAANWGIFQVVNHGIPDLVLENLMTVVKDFFSMPEEEKQLIAKDHENGRLQGYVPFSQLFQKQAAWSNQIEYILQPHHLVGPEDTWPARPAGFRQAIEEYCNEFHSVLAKILELLLSSCLKTSGTRKSSELLDGNQLQVFRASYYDTCPQPEMVMGLRSHVDSSLITAIVQDDTGGLQVEKDGQWYGVAPTPGAVVILLGSVLQVLTNDMLKAVEHRVVVNGESRRMSVTTGINPSSNTIVAPAQELIDELHPPHYLPCEYKEFRITNFEAGVLNSLDALDQYRIKDQVPSLHHRTLFPEDIEEHNPTFYHVGDGRLLDLQSFIREGIVAS
ncbi:hypothetical protein KC19_5G069300 [Ceratodon purpureus]|uniref:Fe2OG dioxygenase domain-containing protein n=1 Tax=Ceratodon purpureus TaxID=3225 RepID=A0A8T0I052_CERPU|nr:hypothetical protein KC19_5G069300 [Ceratodon purpureus]KAG0576291.1 hypothetical protein KC19_5G069300 [Ceratodon purpureus]KAG0576292.1 hypothetical protein KC19_5G069300 [Ceratodon purpureus]